MRCGRHRWRDAFDAATPHPRNRPVRRCRQGHRCPGRLAGALSSHGHGHHWCHLHRGRGRCRRRAVRRSTAACRTAADISADTFQTTRIFDRNGVLLQEIADQGCGWRTFVHLEQISHYVIEPPSPPRTPPSGRTTASSRCHRPRLHDQPRRGLIRRLDDHPAAGPLPLPGRQIGFEFSVTAQVQGSAGRGRARSPVLEARHPDHVSQPDLLRQRLLRHRGGRPDLLPQAGSELTLAEASLLAGMPQHRPTSIRRSISDNAHRRQKYVLDQMVKHGYITRAEANEAYANWPADLTERATATGRSSTTPALRQYVKSIWPKSTPTKTSPRVASTSTRRSTRHCRTVPRRSLAQNIQQLQYYNGHNAALTIVVPWSGEILAMVGSADFNDAAIGGQVNITTSPSNRLGHQAGRLRGAFEQAGIPAPWSSMRHRDRTPGATDP